MVIEVRVHPRNKRPRISRDVAGVFDVYVAEPALADKANQAVLAALAHHFQTSKSNITLVRGAKSKFKLVRILTKTEK